MENMSLLIIKPQAFKNKQVGTVVTILEKNGFEIINMKLLTLNKSQAKRFYFIHSEREFFSSLVDFMSSGKIIVMCVKKENCIRDLRRLVGNTDPAMSEPGTIRAAIGTSIRGNGVHASDSPENARIEITFFFSAMEIK